MKRLPCMHAAIYRAIYWRCVILRQETGPTTVHLDISTSQILHLLWHGKGCKCPIERCFIVRVIENLQKIYNTIIVLLYSQNSRAKSGSKKTHAINFGIFCYFSALWYSDISASNNFFFGHLRPIIHSIRRKWRHSCMPNIEN